SSDWPSMSMKPGATIRPRASIRSRADICASESPSTNAHVRLEPRRAGAVDYPAVLDDDVENRHALSARCPRSEACDGAGARSSGAPWRPPGGMACLAQASLEGSLGIRLSRDAVFGQECRSLCDARRNAIEGNTVPARSLGG